MARRSFETNANRQSEKLVMDEISQKWEVDLKPLPSKYAFDFCVTKYVGGNYNEAHKIEAFCEVKSRKVSSTEFDSTVVTLGKYLEAVKLEESTGISVIIFFKFTDGLFYHRFDKSLKPFYRFRMGGRGRRRDSQDHEPQMLIPISLLLAVE